MWAVTSHIIQPQQHSSLRGFCIIYFCTNVLLANAGMGMEEYGGVGSGHVITITKQIIGNCGQFMVWPLDQWPASLCEVITAKKRGENFNPFTGQKLISCSLYHPSRIAAAVLCQTSSHDTNLCHQLPWIKLNQHYVYWSMQGYCKKVDCFSKMEKWKCLWREPSADIRSTNDRGLFAQVPGIPGTRLGDTILGKTLQLC